MCLDDTERISSLGRLFHYIPRLNFSLQRVGNTFQPASSEYWESFYIFTSLHGITMLIMTFACIVFCCHITFKNKVETFSRFKSPLAVFMISALFSCVTISALVLASTYQLQESVEEFKQTEENFFIISSTGKRGIIHTENYSRSITKDLESIAKIENSYRVHNIINSVQPSIQTLNISMRHLIIPSKTTKLLIDALFLPSTRTVAAVGRSLFISSAVIWVLTLLLYIRRFNLIYFLIIFSIFAILFTLIYYSCVYIIIGTAVADFCTDSCRGILTLFRVIQISETGVIKYYLYSKADPFNPIQNITEAKLTAANELTSAFQKLDPLVRKAESLRIITITKVTLNNYYNRMHSIQTVLSEEEIPELIQKMTDCVCIGFLSWIMQMLIATIMTWILFHIVIIGICHFLMTLRDSKPDTGSGRIAETMEIQDENMNLSFIG